MFTKLFNWLCNKTIRPYLLKALLHRWTPAHDIKNKAHGKLFMRGYFQAIEDMRRDCYSILDVKQDNQITLSWVDPAAKV